MRALGLFKGEIQIAKLLLLDLFLRRYRIVRDLRVPA